MKNIFLKSLVFGGVLLSTTSCWFDKTETNWVFMPNMYYSEAYEPYAAGTDMNKDGEAVNYSALTPVEGTIARGHTAYDNPDTTEGYEAAKANLKSTLNPADAKKDAEQGKYLYNMYCAVCHGTDGDGQGTLVKHEKILGVPDYKTRDINQGSIYHVIMNGKGIMGSHASQTNEKERWQIVKHVLELKGK